MAIQKVFSVHPATAGPDGDPMHRGRFIAVEGIDGCGKSTLAVRLVEAMGGGKMLPRRMPDSAEKLKKLRAAGASQRALQAAYLASIAKVSTSYVVPGLVAGQQMVADRWVGGQLASGWLHSRLAGKANCSGGCVLGKVGEIAVPDIVFFLTAKDEVRRTRMAAREELSPNDEASLVEGAQDLYCTAIFATYPRVVEIDTTNLDQDAVLAEALKHL